MALRKTRWQQCWRCGGGPNSKSNSLAGLPPAPEGSLEPQLRQEPGLLTVVPTLVRAIHPLYDYITLGRLTRIFQAALPQIVHTHSGKAGILGRLAAARAGVPVIVHTIHGPSFGDFQGPVPNFLFTRAERRVGRVTTHFVAVAQAMTRQYLAAGIGRPEQYTRIFSGFDLGPFLSAQNNPELRRRWGIESGDIVIGKIARLFKLKGHDDLLTVAPRRAATMPDREVSAHRGGRVAGTPAKTGPIAWTAKIRHIYRTSSAGGDSALSWHHRYTGPSFAAGSAWRGRCLKPWPPGAR